MNEEVSDPPASSIPASSIKDPILMPSPESRAGEWGRVAENWMRRARAETRRLGELLRAARTPEGRRQNLAPLLLVAAGGGFALGLLLGWRRGGK